ncbi:hypothetical protein C8F01DRAFT_982726, partial [Mycena amicta]
LSDLPASRRTSGLLSFTSTWFMCDRCTLPFFSLTDPDTFNSTKICACKRDPSRHLKYSFRARDASAEVAEQISLRRGICYAPVHNLPNWFPGKTNLVDLMHAIFLCTLLILPPIYTTQCLVNRSRKTYLPKHNPRQRVVDSLLRYYLHSTSFRTHPPLPFAYNTVDSRTLPAHSQIQLTRLLILLLILALVTQHFIYVDTNPEVSAEELEDVDSVTMDRSLKRHYNTLLQFTAAIRILTSNSISPNEVVRGCDMLENAIQSYARMHAHLTPYFHLVVDHLRVTVHLHIFPLSIFLSFPFPRTTILSFIVHLLTSDPFLDSYLSRDPHRPHGTHRTSLIYVTHIAVLYTVHCECYR